MRALPGEPPQSLTAEPDGTILEDLIGELQSTWGVPQYPQEYRLLIKVAESRDRSSARPEVSEEEREPKERRVAEPVAEQGRGNGQPRREKAPLPQELSGGTGPAADRPAGSRSGRKRRRRRRRGGEGSGTG